MKKHKLNLMILGVFISLQIIGSNAFAGEALYKIVGERSDTVCNHCESTFDYDWCSCCYGDHSMSTGSCDHEPRNDEDNILEKKDKTPIIKVIDGVRYLVIK